MLTWWTTALSAMDQAMDPSLLTMAALHLANNTRILGSTPSSTTRRLTNTRRTPGSKETAWLTRTAQEMVGTAHTSNSRLPSSNTCPRFPKPSSRTVHWLAENQHLKLDFLVVVLETTSSSHRWRASLSSWRETFVKAIHGMYFPLPYSQWECTNMETWKCLLIMWSVYR